MKDFSYNQSEIAPVESTPIFDELVVELGFDNWLWPPYFIDYVLGRWADRIAELLASSLAHLLVG